MTEMPPPINSPAPSAPGQLGNTASNHLSGGVAIGANEGSIPSGTALSMPTGMRERIGTELYAASLGLAKAHAETIYESNDLRLQFIANAILEMHDDLQAIRAMIVAAEAKA